MTNQSQRPTSSTAVPMSDSNTCRSERSTSRAQAAARRRARRIARETAGVITGHVPRAIEALACLEPADPEVHEGMVAQGLL
jgi:hypothetical protein